MSFNEMQDDNDLKVPESKHKKSPEDICVLDLLNISKPLKDSCFSEKQIDVLFTLWRDFMYERFKSNSNPQEAARAREDVERLYSNATTTKRKYNSLRLDQNTGVGGVTPAMSESEKTWVMGNQSPTPFIAFIRRRPDVLENLRMSFKPNLLHNGMLEAPDLMMVLQRYYYWLKDDKDRSVNILGVTDDSASRAVNVSTDSMVGNLQQNWVNYRFHVAIVNEGMHWRAVLIDRKSHTFEYYDPLGHNIDLSNTNSPLSIQVARLYETARLLDNNIVTRSMHSVRRGFHKHQTGGTECGMYVILYIHTRVAQQKTFEDFADTEIKSQTCKDLKSLFFTLPDNSSQMVENPEMKNNKDYRLKFGGYDIRLAGIDFLGYISYVMSITNDLSAKNKLQADRNKMAELIRSPGDYITIRVEGMSIQKDLLAVLGPQYKTYAGSDIWFNIVQAVVQDPLTKYLRDISTEKGVRSKNTIRKKIALKFYHDITGWSSRLGAPPQQVAYLEKATREALDTVYIPALRFDSDNHKKFELGMLPTGFIRECMTKQDSVSFGVHFIRYLYDTVKKLNIPVESELNTKFLVNSVIVKPVTNVNLQEIASLVSRCDQTIQQAYQLLQTTFTEKMMITSQVNSNSPNFGPTSIPPPPNFGQGFNLSAPSGATQDYTNKLDRIIALNKIDLQNGSFKVNNIQPYNFPLDMTAFASEQTYVTLPSEFVVYSVNRNEMRQLISNNEFLMHYAMAVYSVLVNLGTKKLNSVTTVYVLFYSLVQFLNATNTLSEERKIICNMLVRLRDGLLKSSMASDPKIVALINDTQTFVGSCSLNGPPNPQFEQAVLVRFNQYAGRS